MTKLVIKMFHSKETPRTHVFTADAPDAPVSTLYVRKTAIPGADAPASITVQITI